MHTKLTIFISSMFNLCCSNLCAPVQLAVSLTFHNLHQHAPSNLSLDVATAFCLQCCRQRFPPLLVAVSPAHCNRCCSSFRCILVCMSCCSGCNRFRLHCISGCHSFLCKCMSPAVSTALHTVVFSGFNRFALSRVIYMLIDAGFVFSSFVCAAPSCGLINMSSGSGLRPSRRTKSSSGRLFATRTPRGATQHCTSGRRTNLPRWSLPSAQRKLLQPRNPS